jgi:rod shape determining protein RodA
MEHIRRWAIDPAFVFTALGLSIFGVAMIYSAGVVNSPGSFVTGIWVRQASWLGISLVAFSVVSRVPLRWFEWAAIPGYVLATVLLAITLIIGTGAGTAAGTKSFIGVGSFGFQPAELAKLATALALGRVLASREVATNLRQLLIPSLLVAFPMLLILGQPDLGSALAFVGILFAALFWAGTPFVLLVLLASPGAALLLTFDTRVWSAYFILLAGFLYWQRYRLFFVESVAVLLANLSSGVVALPLWASLGDYQRNRLLVFLDPSIDPRGVGYHLTQSKIAIGSGELFGKGFTTGTQKALDFLPEQHTDFIVSVVGEELGFIGVALLILAFGFFLSRLVRMAQKAPDPFAGLVAFGIFGAWLVHIFVNMGMTVGLVPITGIPLPFVSYGGTFLLVCWVAVAMVARLAHET